MNNPLSIPRYIVVEGVIGVGKSTLVAALAERLNARTVFEVFDENPFLAMFYDERDRWAFPTEMFFLLSRFAQQETFAQGDLLRSHAVSDYIFEKCLLFASETLKGPEAELFERTWQALVRYVAKPDIVVYLRAPVDVLLERIQERGRSYELQMAPEYLAALDQRYQDFFAGYTQAPVLTVDTTAVDFRNPRAVDALLERIAAGGGAVGVNDLLGD